MTVQAGAFGEHAFTSVEDLSAEGAKRAVDGKMLNVVLPPGKSLKLKLGMKRYCHAPSYQQPL